MNCPHCQMSGRVEPLAVGHKCVAECFQQTATGECGEARAVVYEHGEFGPVGVMKVRCTKANEHIRREP